MKIKHNLTGCILEIISSNTKTHYCKVLEVPTPTPGVRVGGKIKVGVHALGITYTLLP